MECEKKIMEENNMDFKVTEIEDATETKFDQEIHLANITITNIGAILDCLEKIQGSDTSGYQKNQLINSLQIGMSEYQTHYAKALQEFEKKHKKFEEMLFDFGNEVKVSDIGEGIDRFKTLSSELIDISDEVTAFKNIVTRYRDMLIKISKLTMVEDMNSEE